MLLRNKDAKYIEPFNEMITEDNYENLIEITVSNHSKIAGSFCFQKAYWFNI